MGWNALSPPPPPGALSFYVPSQHKKAVSRTWGFLFYFEITTFHQFIPEQISFGRFCLWVGGCSTLGRFCRRPSNIVIQWIPFKFMVSQLWTLLITIGTKIRDDVANRKVCTTRIVGSKFPSRGHHGPRL